jgi:hypothetical protein
MPPQWYRQAKVCETEAAAFQSAIERMETLIGECEPVVGTRTPVVLDRWSGATGLWHAARERDVLITTGLTSNRWPRLSDDTTQQGWRGSKLSDALTSVTAQDGVQLCWPRGGKKVSVHVGNTQVRTLSRCQIVIVRPL